MKTFFPRHLRGFTLVEALLSSIISLIVIGTLISFFLDTMIGKNLILARQELEYNLQFAVSQINSSLKQATGIDELSSTLDAHPGTLRFSTVDPNNNPTVIESSGSDLHMTRGAGVAQNLLTSKNTLSNLQFSFKTPANSPGIVTGTITLQSLLDPTIEKTETFSFNLRTNVP